MAYVLCPGCEYFIPKDNFPNYGECRKNAPRPAMKTTDNLIVPETHATIWPYVRDVDGCFEGKIKRIKKEIKTLDQNITPSRAMSSPQNPFDKTVRDKQKNNNRFDEAVKKKNGKAVGNN
jgi:hypothetical protein